MMSKEECQKALDYLFDNSLIDDYSNNIDNKMYDILQRMIDEHFELLDGIQTIINKAKELSDSNDELKGLYFITPYKLEDLKEDMWVYDGIEKLICQIGLISKNAIHREYVDGTISDSPFEENRFYPPQMANIINIKKENKKQ